jgi:hypothetical protein
MRWRHERNGGHDGRSAEGFPADHQLSPTLHLAHREKASQLEKGGIKAWQNINESLKGLDYEIEFKYFDKNGKFFL